MQAEGGQYQENHIIVGSEFHITTPLLETHYHSFLSRKSNSYLFKKSHSSVRKAQEILLQNQHSQI